jgi:hypothetical protein
MTALRGAALPPPKLPLNCPAREAVFRVKVDPQKGALWCLHHLEQLIEKFRIAISDF